MIAVLMTGCAGSGAPKDATDRSHDAGFDQTIGVADSLCRYRSGSLCPDV